MYKLLQPWQIDEDDELYELMKNDDRKRTIEGEKFTKLMELLFEHATYFSLNISPWTDAVDKSLENDLSPYLIKSIKVKKWFGYDFTGTEHFSEVCIYRSETAAKDILLKYHQDLFLQEVKDGEMVDSTQTLEDLCFFIDNRLFLGTIDHEGICILYPSDKVDEQFILGLGEWRFCDDESQLIDITEYV